MRHRRRITGSHPWTTAAVVGVVIVVLIGVVALALQLTSKSNAAGRTTAAGYGAREMRTVRLPGGVTVVLPPGATARSYGITTKAASAASRAHPLAPGLVPLVTPRDYRSRRPIPAGTKLVAQVGQGRTGLVLEAFFDPATGNWVPEPTTYDPATGVATASLAHFSIHSFWNISKDYLKSLLTGALNNVMSGLQPGTQDPNCGNPNGVEMIYSGGNSSVATCHDATIVRSPSVSDPGLATITVRFTNKRKYPVDVDYPFYGQATVSDHASVAAQIGGLLNGIAATPNRHKAVLVPGGATATVVIPNVAPPFKGLYVTADFDGEAYLTQIMGTAIEELSLVAGESASALINALKDGWDGGQVVYRAQSELSSPNLSPDTIKTLTDVGIDALLVVYEKTSTSMVVSILKVVTELGSELAQSVQGLVDVALGQSDHTYTFTTYGSTWSPPPPLHSVNWGDATIPGAWFLGPASVTLHDSSASNVQTRIPGPGYNGQDGVMQVYGGYHVVYGTLGSLPIAAVDISVQAGGTADSVRADGWVVFTGGPGDLRVIGVITPQSGLPNSWSPNPQARPNVTYIGSLTIQPGRITAHETYYRTNDTTAGPSGAADTTWALSGGNLVATGTRIIH